MRWMVALSLLSIGMMALAGCSDKKDEPEATTSSTITTTTAPAPALNQQPSGSLTALVNGTNAAFRVEGSDPDGDALTWTLSFGDGNQTNGTMVPANLTHAYGTAGLFNASVSISDGNATVVYNATINATLSTGAGPTSVVFTGHVMAPSPSYNTEGECLEAIFVDDFGSIFEVPSETWGWAYAFDVDGMTAIFYSEGLAENLQEGPSGIVPQGAVEVIACSQLAIDTDYTLILTPAA